MSSEQSTNRKYITYAIILWSLLYLALLVFADPHRTVSFNYWLAAQHWLREESLYLQTGKGFIYLPQAAILYIPLTWLPFPWSEAVWRLLSLTVFVWGLWRITPLLLTPTESHSVPVAFFWLTLLAIPLCFNSVRNGQMHLLNTGILMLATVACQNRQWQKATFLITLAVFLKPTAIVFLLLTLGIYFTETVGPFALWVSAFMLLPWVTQSWGYVLSQWEDCWKMLIVASQPSSAQDWTQFFNLISQTGWETPPLWQNILRAVVALCTLWIGRRSPAIWILLLGMTYITLFNPRSELNDYMMLTPVLGYAFFHSATAKHKERLFFLFLITGGIIGGNYLSNLLPGHHNWAAPLMGVLLSGYLWMCYDRPFILKVRSL